MAFVIAVTNQKGGVGKSTTTINVGAALADLGHPTLLVDLDPHAGLTKMLRHKPDGFSETFFDVLLGSTKAEQLVQPLPFQNLEFTPSNDKLAVVEAELRRDPDWGNSLAEALEPLRKRYHYILIDCPPSLGVLSTIGVRAADGVLVPVQSDFIAVTSLDMVSQLVEAVGRKKASALPLWIVPTFYDRRTRHAQDVIAAAAERFQGQFSKVIIPRTVRFPDSTVDGKPLIHFDSSHPGALAYRELATEITQIWENEK